MSISVSVCLSLCFSLYLSLCVSLSVSLSVCLSLSLSLSLSLHLTIFLSPRPLSLSTYTLVERCLSNCPIIQGLVFLPFWQVLLLFQISLLHTFFPSFRWRSSSFFVFKMCSTMDLWRVISPTFSCSSIHSILRIAYSRRSKPYPDSQRISL